MSVSNQSRAPSTFGSTANRLTAMSNRLTIIEIAQHAGVSRSTVSRVINDDPNVNSITRERVRTVMQKLNYQPNAAARGLAAGRTRILGLVIPMGVGTLFTDPYFPLLIQGIYAACSECEYSTMLWLAEPEYERRTIRQILQSGVIDGVIVASAMVQDPLIEALIKSDLPFVLVGRYPNSSRVNYVDVDNRPSARDAVLYLSQLGYKRIATIAGLQNHVAGVDRLNGYKDALRARGVPLDPHLIVHADFTEGGGYSATLQLLPHSPRAAFCASDAMALGALRALREVGKRVPKDIAVVGFDDLPVAARTEPPLTTVRQPIDRAGSVAAEMLIDLIHKPAAAPRRVILPTELAIRKSCGAELPAKIRISNRAG